MRRLELELVIDSFAGGGGASLGIEQAIGRPVDIAINHDAEAIAMHQANHPETEHYQEDVWQVDPLKATGGRPVALAWFSPDCTHHSKARGGKPRDKNIRGLAWVALRWAAKVRPRVLIVENVEEFRSWGPLNRRRRPKRNRKGETFDRWVSQLRGLGYEVEWRELRACDFGAPTSRKRLFIIARCDGELIRWPAPTHSNQPLLGLAPYRTAAECIDWSIPCPSIFERPKPLAAATLRRIANGIRRYVIEAERPFVINLTHGGRLESVDEPFATITGAHRGEKALVAPYLARNNHDGQAKPTDSVDEPLRTITTQGNKHALVTPFLAGITHNKSGGQTTPGDAPMPTITTSRGGEQALIAPTLVQTGYGERAGQSPRSLDIEEPLGTVVGGGSKHALVAGFLAKHFGGHETPGSDLGQPADTVTARDHHGLVASSLVKLYGTNDGADIEQPMPTVTSTGQHLGEVRAFLAAYYGNDKDGQAVSEPFRTVTSKERFGLVTVEGEPYAIVDIGMRMLAPRELFRAQGFPEGYVIDPVVNGRRLTKTDQIRMCGNSVCPPIARALVSANVVALGQPAMWAGYELAAGGAG